MSVAWWIAFAISAVILPIDCVFFCRNAARGELRMLNLVSIVVWVGVIAFVATSGFFGEMIIVLIVAIALSGAMMIVLIIAIALSVTAVILAGGAVAIVSYRRGMMHGAPNIADFCNRLRHISLNIEHQPHAVNYQTVEEWLAEHPEQFDPDDRAQMVATGEVWYVMWHPRTPVGWCHVAASTLERAIQLSLAEAEDQDLTADKPAVVRTAVGDVVRVAPQPIPGVATPWAGRYGRIEWIRDGDVRIDFGDGEHVTCGPGDIAPP